MWNVFVTEKKVKKTKERMERKKKVLCSKKWYETSECMIRLHEVYDIMKERQKGKWFESSLAWFSVKVKL